MASIFTEAALVQQTTADYLHDVPGWRLVYACNTETFGPGGLRSANARRLCGELSLIAALTNPGELMTAHRRLERNY